MKKYLVLCVCVRVRAFVRTGSPQIGAICMRLLSVVRALAV